MKSVVICGSRKFEKEIRKFGSELRKLGVVVYEPILNQELMSSMFTIRMGIWVLVEP